VIKNKVNTMNNAQCTECGEVNKKYEAMCSVVKYIGFERTESALTARSELVHNEEVIG